MSSRNAIKNGVKLLTVSATAKKLGITRVTLYKWISMGLVKPEGHQMLGDRHMYWFDPDTVAKISTLIPKKRNKKEKHMALLTPEIEEKLKRIS